MSADHASGWKLRPDIAEQTQGLVVSGFGALRFGRALCFSFDSGLSRGGWLAALDAVAPVTKAVPPVKGRAEPRAAALALSWHGLRRMGLDKTALASFSRPFREGMFQEDRLRRLGDRRGGVWLESVAEDGPRWSANTPLRDSADGLRSGFDVPDGAAEEQRCATDVTVHAIVLLYTLDDDDADTWSADVAAALLPAGVTVARSRSLVVDPEHSDGPNVSREHFGFADGLSQPHPYDPAGAVIRAGVPVTKAHAVQGVPLGEFLMGYINGHGEPAPGPVLPITDGQDATVAATGLVPHPTAEGFLDLGLNGSYMVVRELKQDVAAFWQSMDASAARIREQDPRHGADVTADWVAERVVGRNKDGHLLCPAGTLKAVNGNPDNDYTFWEDDRPGYGCPVGSHVRRANPRDAMARDENARADLLNAVNRHRILRRGRKYGPAIADHRVDDGQDRGLMFMCLNTDIARQFEFVQQIWLLNDSFATLYQEQDPLVGVPGPMTIRERPLRRTVHVDTYVQMVGGDYYFLPSLPALRYFATL
jgi:Dyp-type peroxidase family